MQCRKELKKIQSFVPRNSKVESHGLKVRLHTEINGMCMPIEYSDSLAANVCIKAYAAWVST